MAKRRGNGEGSLRKRSDGRWEGRYTAGTDPNTGKPISRNVLGRTQAEMREKLKAAIQQAEQVDVTQYEKYTVGQWANVWFSTYAKPNIRESTALYYQNYIDNHIVPNIGKIQLKKLTTLDLQKFYNKMKTSGRVKWYKNMANKGLSNKQCVACTPCYTVAWSKRCRTESCPTIPPTPAKFQKRKRKKCT